LRQKAQEKAFAVDSIHQSADVQLEGQTAPEAIGSQWGLKPTKTWVPGPGGDSRDTPVPSGQADAEAKLKAQYEKFAVDSIHQNADAQVSN
jgi:hypothetical protein